MKKFLFLDFDGVLNSHLWEISPRYVKKAGPEIDPLACSLLKKTLDQIGNVEIVIISSYRDEYSLDELKKFLVASNLNSLVIAKTDSEPISKSMGIIDYLKNHPCDKFAILDDETVFDLSNPYNKNQVKTSLHSGINEYHMDKLKEILGD